MPDFLAWQSSGGNLTDWRLLGVAAGARVSSEPLRDLQAHRRRAVALGDLHWEIADREILRSSFAALLRLHAARCRLRDEGGVLRARETDRHFWSVKDCPPFRRRLTLRSGD